MFNKSFSNRKAKFSCPLSSYIAWHWGLTYKECPVEIGERDMDECRSCSLCGRESFDEKNNKRKNRKRKKSEE